MSDCGEKCLEGAGVCDSARSQYINSGCFGTEQPAVSDVGDLQMGVAMVYHAVCRSNQRS